MVGRALHHVSLNVTDVRACVAFYEAMGFREIERPQLGFDGAWMRIGETGELHLLGFPPPEAVGQHFAVHVDDLDEALEDCTSEPEAVLESLQEARRALDDA